MTSECFIPASTTWVLQYYSVTWMIIYKHTKYVNVYVQHDTKINGTLSNYYENFTQNFGIFAYMESILAKLSIATI